MKQFSGVRQLFAGKGMSTPPEDDDHNENGPGATGATGGPSEAQVNKLVAEEADKARTAANERWNTVMTSDAGAANPKAAARLLMAGGGTMGADEIVATLGDIGPAAATDKPGQTAQTERTQQLAEDAKALSEDKDANPKTGAAGSRPGVRTGEGEDKDRTARREARAKRVQARNPKPRS